MRAPRLSAATAARRAAPGARGVLLALGCSVVGQRRPRARRRPPPSTAPASARPAAVDPRVVGTVATDLEHRGASRSCPTAPRSCPSATAATSCRSRPTAPSPRVGTVPGVRARAARAACSASPLARLRHDQPGLRLPHARDDNRIVRMNSTDGTSARRRSCSSGLRQGRDPRRRPDRVRSGRLPLHRRRRHRQPRARAEPVEPNGKILRVTTDRRARAGQPVPRLAGLQLRPPQRPGPRVGLAAAGCGRPSSARTPGTS